MAPSTPSDSGQYTGAGALNGNTYSAGYIPAHDLHVLPDNVLVGCRNYGGTIADGFNGAIDEVRLFTFAQGAFNIADTNPVPEPGLSCC